VDLAFTRVSSNLKCALQRTGLMPLWRWRQGTAL